jgi:uncharacterized membrane-anchored protein YitT (DUF2179 family)
MNKIFKQGVKLNKKSIRDYIFIALGAAIMAIGIGVFLVDARVVPGGVSGLSMAVYYLTAMIISQFGIGLKRKKILYDK